MSMSPHQIFGRLQELKKWQQTHEILLRRSNVDEEFEKTSIINSHSSCTSGNMNEISSRNMKPNSTISPFESSNTEQIKGVQGKNFEEILEEKLTEYAKFSNQTEDNSIRTKKPFLKKGTGLMKYNLNPEEYKEMIGNKCLNTISQYKSRPKSVQISKKYPSAPDRPKTSNAEKQSSLIRKSRNSNSSLNRKSRSNPQRSKTILREYSRREEPLNVCVLSKDGNSNAEQHSLEYVAKKMEHSKDIVENVSASHGPKLTEADRTSPKLKDFIHTIMKNTANPATFTPLKAPDMSIKPRGSWCGTAVTKFQNDSISHKAQWVDSFQQSDNCSKDKYTFHGVLQSEWKNGSGNQMNGMVNRMLQIDDVREVQNDRIENKPAHSESGARKSLSYTPSASEQSLYERALETELMIFEALERRTEQSGFCSTNTSIIQLLSSSPSKLNFKKADDYPVFDRIIDTNEDIEDQPVRDKNVTSTPGSDRFETASEESEFDHHLQNDDHLPVCLLTEDHSRYRNHITEELNEDDTETEEEVDHKQVENYRDKRRQDILVHSQGPQSGSHSSEDSDCSDDYSVESVKAYKNSKFGASSVTSPNISHSCSSCGFLIKNKIQECESELNSLKNEKNRIVAIREQMARDKKEFEREMKNRKKQFEDQRRRFQIELEEEKRKISEKTAVEKPHKEIKAKLQHKKDREEVNNLKIELNETKELMKLRETKNAMCIARLRNQVKLLEKNNAELKSENEKLLKEKSKLVAQQKSSNKTSETKMLREISKNISKLTEEKFKNQLFKADTSSEELVQGGCKGDSETKSTKSSTGIKKTVVFSCHGHGEGPVEGNYSQQLCSKIVDDKCIEEKYRSLFGGQAVILENSSNDQAIPLENTTTTGLSKTENVLEDGTKEIRYSNGNIKLISENGTVRYYYANNDTWHTNFADGTEVLEFPNGQSEKRFKDGKCLIFFPDGLVQTIFPNGTEEVKYPDGSKLVTKKDGDRMLFLSNGQVEIHTKDQKRREYPDGTVKILYPDGSQETRYSNGRVRVKNNEGDIILDTGEQDN